jgi:hypothetical protein
MKIATLRRKTVKTSAAKTGDGVQEVLKLFVLCDNTEAFIPAMELRKHLENTPTGKLRIQANFCHYRWLGFSGLNRMAAKVASKADMILFSTGESGSVPEHVEKWIQCLTENDSERKTAYVVLLNSQRERTGAASPIETLVRNSAELNGADFFCNLVQKETAVNRLKRAERPTDFKEMLGAA